MKLTASSLIGLLTGLCLLVPVSCQRNGSPDAYGIMEAQSWMIASPEAGQILTLDITEGARVAQDERAVQLDSIHLVLQRQALEAQIQALLPSLRSDTPLEKTYAQVNLASLRSQVELFNERIARCAIRNPEDGVVAAIYAHAHEFVAAGQPIYKLADYRNLFVEAWLEAGQLVGLVPGDEVQVRIEAPEGGWKTIPGRIAFIAEEAEFAPNKVMTRETRTRQVYHIRINVAGDGTLKAGMPAEIFLPSGK